MSNFQPAHLEYLLQTAEVVPAVNQIELHPWLQQAELRALHASLGITTEAWSPLGRGQVLQDPVVVELAAAHRRTAAQIILRWHLELGNVVIPKASSYTRSARTTTSSVSASAPRIWTPSPAWNGASAPARTPTTSTRSDRMEHVATESSPAPPLLSAELESRSSASAVDLDGTRVAYWSYEPVRETEATRPSW